jgi:hypothetical protein
MILDLMSDLPDYRVMRWTGMAQSFTSYRKHKKNVMDGRTLRVAGANNVNILTKDTTAKLYHNLVFTSKNDMLFGHECSTPEIIYQ